MRDVPGALDMHLICLVIRHAPGGAHAINRALEPFAIRPYHVGTVEAATRAVRQWRFDVALLDADGCGGRAAVVLTALREARVPVVVRSRACDDETQVRLLEQGATAVVPDVESTRLTALRLRKLAELHRPDAVDRLSDVRVGPLLIETRRARASVDGTRLELSPRPFEILLLMATRPGEFVHRRDFASTSRLPGEEGSRSIDVHVSRLRDKLRRTGCRGLCIATVHGLGYCLTYQEDEAAADAVPA